MGKKRWLNIFTALLIAGMVFGGYLPRNVTAQVPTPEPVLPLAPGGEGVTADPLAKVDSELRSLAAEGGETPVQVYILAKEGADLSRVATVTETRPFPDGAELVVATVLPSQIEKLASHPDVVAAEAFHAIEAPIPLTPKEDVTRMTAGEARALREQALEDLQPRELPAGFKPSVKGQITSADDWNGASLIGAPEAWAKGYTGEGVNIAILDSGIDFGHPDLENNIAFYEDGPYAGWPIALDPYSMRNYYYEGYTGWYNYWWGDNYSWYADVHDVIICAGGSDEVFYFNESEYTIAQDWVDMSLSGEIRWGVHPDYQLYSYVYDWVPFILIDTTVAGVYDTVIADLNFDYWFDQYDDTAVLGTDDPVLNQDLGSYVYTNTVVMTGTMYVPSSLWWYPPLWYGYNMTSGEEVMPAGTFIYAKNHYSPEEATDGADGIEEISGGMVYFIADGNLPVPGMDYLYPGFGPAGMDPIPLNGQLVAFMLGSAYAGGGDHGTLCASAAVAGGQINGYFGMFGEFVQYDPEDWSGFLNADDVSEYLPWLKAADEGTVQGAAPGANLIAIGDNYGVVNGMQGFYDAYTFLAYGVDGVPNTGDEFVDIASMSYGDGSVHNDGWDWESRLISYYNQQYLPNTTFFASSGNGGPGFGTVNSPQGNTVVSVGASTQYGASTAFGSAISAEQINDGEVVHFSGRGPDAMGRPDPDVVATGGWGAGDGPLNMNAIYNYSYGAWFPGDGNNAWYEWGGTSRSAPEAAGVMATIYQAYEEANGVKPDFETARQILMGGAQDLNHDVLRQGAGRVNADTGTDIAAGLGGVYVSPSLLSAGEYMGDHYESFGNVLFPGDEWTQTFTVTNPGAAAATLDLGDEMMLEIETQTFDQVVRPYLGTEGPYPDTYYYWADYFVTTDPDLTDGYAFVRVAHASPDAPSVEVCVDGGVAFQDAPFGAVTGYAALPSGEHFVEVFPAYSGCAGTAVISATLDLAPFGDYTVVATDFLADITPVVLVDNNSEPEEGNAHVRFFHASPDAPAVDIAVVDGPILFENIAFQEVGDYLPVPGDTAYDLEVLLTGTDTVVLTIPGLYLVAGEVYTVFALGTVDPFTLYALPVQDTPLPTRPVSHGADLAITVPEGADFMEVEVTVPFELFDYCYNDPDPWSICYGGQHRYSLTVYDWTDRNVNDQLWLDANGDEVVSYYYGDVIEVSATEQVTQTELNRFTYAYNHANIQGATVRLGDRDDIDNIILGLVHNQPNNARDGEDYYEANPLQVKVVFYEKVDWPIVETSVASLTVPAGGEASFDATFTIPDDPTLYGVHEGAITVGDALIPTTVNVAVPNDEMLFTLGGNEDSGTPYDNSRMGPGYTWSGVLEEGDWRFYYYDAETGLDQQYLYVRNQWGELCGNMPTFNETLVWGPNFGDQFSMLEPDKYGPYGLQFAGGTDYANTGDPYGWYGPRVWAGWYDGDGIPQPESRAWATLWDGLNQVQFRNVLMSGKHSCGEGFEATAGVFGVDAPETGIIINTDQTSGSFNLDAISPVDGLIAYAAGFGQEEWFRNQDVPQGKHTGEEWPADLMDGWVHTFEVENTWGIEAETFGPWPSDIDLYLLYDANNDGLFNIYDNREALAYSRWSGTNEYIDYWGNFSSGYEVSSGTYALVMYGYWIEPGDQFDLRLNLYGGDALNVEGFNDNNNFVMEVTPGELQNLTVNWEVPENGTWQGMLWLGMPWEESPMYYSMGPGFYIPVVINAGGIVLGNTTKQVDITQALVDSNTVLTYDIIIVNEGTEDIWVHMTDLMPEGTTFHEQFVQNPSEPPGVGWTFIAKWWYENGEMHYFWPGDYCYGGDDHSVQATGDYYPYLCWDGQVGPSTSGKVYIQYEVKVLPGFVGTVTNKADFFADWGENYHEFFARQVTTDIFYGVFLPLMTK